MSFSSNLGSSALEQVRSLVLNMGQSAVHTLMPDDYEYYLCALELYNSDMEKCGYISFVVMPDQMSESHTPIQNIVKTHGGIVTVFNPTFAPVDISIAGTFGKKWRLTTGMKDPTVTKSFNLTSGGLSINGAIGVKSGYGLTKLLDKIIQKANELDDKGKPYFLCFNNYALNTAYVVNVMNYNYSQSYETNMMWHYMLQMRAVGYKPSAIDKKSNLLASVAGNAIAGGLTKIISGMTGI